MTVKISRMPRLTGYKTPASSRPSKVRLPFLVDCKLSQDRYFVYLAQIPPRQVHTINVQADSTSKGLCHTQDLPAVLAQSVGMRLAVLDEHYTLCRADPVYGACSPRVMLLVPVLSHRNKWTLTSPHSL